MIATEELELNLIRVASYPKSIFKYHLVYKSGNATGMIGVYSFDEDWYYLYKRDTERYKVRRRKDLEGKEPSFVYRQEIRKSVNQSKDKGQSTNRAIVAENGGSFVTERTSLNDDVQKYFGDRFLETQDKSRFDVMIDHFSKKFSISCEQAKDAYEKTRRLHEEGKIEKFSGYFAAICKSMSTREYTPEQSRKYIEYNIQQRKDEQLIDFMQKYENGERRVFAPNFGITKKEHNDMVYEAAKQELEARRNKFNASEKKLEQNMIKQ